MITKKKKKKTEDLTVKQHEKKKKQWRENSARHYAKNKTLNAILDLTPPSINEPDSAQVQVQDVQVAPSPPQLPFNCLTPVQTSTPKAGRKRKATITSLRGKLRDTKEKLEIRAKEICNLKKQLRRLQKKEKGPARSTCQKRATHQKDPKTDGWDIL